MKITLATIRSQLKMFETRQKKPASRPQQQSSSNRTRQSFSIPAALPRRPPARSGSPTRTPSPLSLMLLTWPKSSLLRAKCP